MPIPSGTSTNTPTIRPAMPPPSLTQDEPGEVALTEIVDPTDDSKQD